jgi:hypothetical protein
MGLLDKALRGASTPAAAPRPVQGGFYAKAAASRQPPAREAEPALDAESLEIALPRRGDVDVLETEIRGLPGKADFFLSAYTRISLAIPFRSLAFFLPCGDALALAASRGFAVPSSTPLPREIALNLEIPGALISSASLDALAHSLGTLPPEPLQGSALRSPSDASLQGLWVYSFSGTRARSSAEAAAVAGLLANCSKDGASALAISSPDPAPASSLFRSIPPDHCAVAIRFDLDPLYEQLRTSIPGLRREAFSSVCASAARALVDPHGKALWYDGARLALVLYSSAPLDAELALFQFRKSFARSLSFFTGEKVPSGEAFPIDPAESGAEGALVRFLSG